MEDSQNDSRANPVIASLPPESSAGNSSSGVPPIPTASSAGVIEASEGVANAVEPSGSTGESTRDVPLSAPSNNYQGQDDGHSASAKPKLRIKLKLSPKRRDTKNGSESAETARAEGDTAQTEEEEEDWLCLKCINHNAPKRIRCWNCKGWKGGKRENFNPNKNKDENDDGDLMEVDADSAAAIEDSTLPFSEGQAVTETGTAEDDDDDEDKPLKSKSIKNKSEDATSTNSSPSSQSKPAPTKSSSSEPKKPKRTRPSNTLRSAAAAHRNRQIHVPPIGSPGLLMLPNPGLVANFPNDDGKKKTTIDDVAHLLHNGYILPQTVFNQSMIAGGYTMDNRMHKPHRGSSTQRIVGDMFDSDINLYLHFPELIPLDVWEKRLKKPKVVKTEELGGVDQSSQNRATVQNEGEVNKVSSLDPPDVGAGDQTTDPEEADVKNENGLKAAVSSNQPEHADGSSDEEEQGPRLVDLVIQSLGKLTGDIVHRIDDASSSADNSTTPDQTSSNPGISTVPLDPSKPTLFELPKFNPAQPGLRKRSCRSQPTAFLDMIPISLTSTYPSQYIEKRRAYTKAVKEREHLIVESQEAVDDAIDNKEKYQAHKEAWDRMFEYQKQQIEKREAAAEAAERKAKEEAAELESQEVKNGGSNGDSTAEGKDDAKRDKPQKERKKENPMDYMPDPPELPPPERHIDVPDIPTPPTPPPVFEFEEGSDETLNVDENDRLNKMTIPKVDPKLIQHLDPESFLPIPEGRYFGLLSNSIADPLFVGHAASGIRGVTSGGGTGLATAYVGGGRGAQGLMSGPVRGGKGVLVNQQPRDSQAVKSSTSSSGLKSNPKKKKKEQPSSKPEPVEKKDSTKSSAETSQPPSSKKKKKKRPVSETGGAESDGSKKKAVRAIPLATGDRNTLATEIASGPCDDEFPPGWTVKTYRRAGGETVGKTDRFWFSPGLNIRFRAKKHAMSFIEILEEPEVNGDEQLAAETYRNRGLHF